jgi:hypothetical protein
VPEGKRFCESYGARIGATITFCPNCGAAQKPDPEVPTGPSPEMPETGRIETPNISVPCPQSSAGRRGWVKFVVGGRGVLLLLFLLVVACSVVVANRRGGGRSSGSNSGSSSSESSNTQKSGDTTVGIGQMATSGDGSWVVNSANPVSAWAFEAYGRRVRITEGEA